MECAVKMRKPEILRDVGARLQSVAGVGDGDDDTVGSIQGRPDDDVKGLASDNFVSLPGWFPIDKATAVLRKKGKRFALVGDCHGMGRVADIRDLESAPPMKSVAWCAVPLGIPVTPMATWEEVSRLMDARHSAHLPVVVGGVLVGIIARDDVLGDATTRVTEPSVALVAA